MTMFLVTLGFFAVALAGMAVGVILSNRRLKGSCGGLGTIRDEHGRSMCEGCTTPAENCSRKLAEAASSADQQEHAACDEHEHAATR
jgi:hypothetical protein